MKTVPSPDKPLILIDGSGFIFRAFYALPAMSRPDGTPVNAVYGFTNMLLRILLDNTDCDIGVIFDAKRKNFRHEIYPDYKGHRPDPPEELIPQFALIHEACRALNTKEIRIEGFEADDIIATFARIAAEQGRKTRIISGDKDLMQLVRDGVELFDPMKNKRIDADAIHAKFGVTPDKVIDVQALCGDSSDNIPGVPGIGVKTAAELILAFGSLEELLKNTDQIKQPKRRLTLAENSDNAVMSKKLVTLRDDVPVTDHLDDFRWTLPDPEKLSDFLDTNGLKSLKKRLENEGWLNQNAPSTALHVDQPKRQTPEVSYTLIRTMDELTRLVETIYAYGTVAVDTETTSLDAMTADLLGLSFAVTPYSAYYVSVCNNTPTARDDLFASNTPQQKHGLPVSDVLQALSGMLSDPTITKVGQNIKYDWMVLRQHGVDLRNVHDTMLMSYVLNGGKHPHNMDELAKNYLDTTTQSFKEILSGTKGAKTLADVPLDQVTHYACEDADITLRLYQYLLPNLMAQGMFSFYMNLERPLIEVLLSMEQRGITLDPVLLGTISQQLSLQISAAEKEIFALAGSEFNVASPKQVGEILFDRLGIRPPKKGKVTTDAATLEELAAQGIVIADKILHWRQVSKLKSTYTDALPGQINPQTGRVHTSFSMSITSTGRLSSSDPNLQNIPVRTPEGRKIREAFIAAPGMSLISLDYSQIELRLLAHIAGIESLQTAFNNGQDIHAMTAATVFETPLGDVTKELRARAKAINFGIIYGISPYGLARQLKVSQSDAKRYIDAYFLRYPGIQTYMDKMIATARTHGYVETLLGRRCHTPSITSKNHSIRSFAERQAINAPLQGSNADIIKIAMRQIHDYLLTTNTESRIVLQVHDELILETPQNDAEAIAVHVQGIMNAVIKLSVPLVVDYGIGSNWSQIH